MGFSPKARRLAAATKAVVEEIKLEPAEPVHVWPDTDLPTIVPLDRRREVPIDTMSRDELLRSLSQAETRVSRLKSPDDPNAPRYRSYLLALQAETTNRAVSGVTTQPDTRPPPVAPAQRIDFVEGNGTGEGATSGHRPPRDPEMDAPVHPSLRGRRATGPDFSGNPADTPESPLI